MGSPPQLRTPRQREQVRARLAVFLLVPYETRVGMTWNCLVCGCYRYPHALRATSVPACAVCSDAVCGAVQTRATVRKLTAALDRADERAG